VGRNGRRKERWRDDGDGGGAEEWNGSEMMFEWERTATTTTKAPGAVKQLKRNPGRQVPRRWKWKEGRTMDGRRETGRRETGDGSGRARGSTEHSEKARKRRPP
jgi:hypothetical protein